MLQSWISRTASKLPCISQAAANTLLHYIRQDTRIPIVPQGCKWYNLYRDITTDKISYRQKVTQYYITHSTADTILYHTCWWYCSIVTYRLQLIQYWLSHDSHETILYNTGCKNYNIASQRHKLINIDLQMRWLK